MGLLGGGAAGLAAAGDPEGPAPRNDSDWLPERFGVAEPALGDRGVFAASLVEQTPAGAVVLEPEHTFVEFEWTLPEWVRDAQGQLRLAWTLQYRPLAADSAALTLLVDSETRQPLGYREASNWSTTSGNEGFAGLAYAAEIHFERRETVYAAATGANVPPVLCGLRHPLQGSSRALEGPVAVFDSCTLFGQSVSGEPLSLEATGTGTVGPFAGARFVHEAGRGDSAALHGLAVWLSPSVPYPLRMERPRSDSPHRYDVLRLAAFEPGQQALPRAAAVPVAAAPLEWRPTQLWGPDDAGLDHPFPLSAAFAWLQEDDVDNEYRDFMATHPDAFTHSARLVHFQDDGDDYYEWQIGVTDGRDDLRTCPARHFYHPTREILVTGQLPDGVAVPETYAETCDAPPSLEPPLPRASPDTMPTLESLAGRWRLHATGDFAAAPANHWSFEIACPDEACAAPETLLSVGHLTDSAFKRVGADPTSYPLEVDLQYLRSLATFDGDGRAVSMVEVEQTNSQAYAFSHPPNAVAADDPILDRPAIVEASVVSATWGAPAAGTAAGVGLVAVGAGLVYWLWPLLHGAAAAPGYSRVVRSSALDHPCRSALLQLVEANPGIHLQDVMRRLGLANGTALHHLRKLADVGLVAQVSASGYTCYFPQGRFDHRAMAATPVLKSGTARRILAAVRGRPGSSGRGIAAAVGADSRTVSYHLQRLQATGLVTTERQGKELAVRATALGASMERLGALSQPVGAARPATSLASVPPGDVA